MPHNMHIIVYKSEETWLLTLFTHPMSPYTCQGCPYQPWAPLLPGSPSLVDVKCPDGIWLTDRPYNDVWAPKKKT